MELLSRKYLMMLIVLMGTFMVVLDGSVVNIALPTITSYFHVDMDTSQWVVTAYLVSVVFLLILFGRAADYVGRARMFKIGFSLFTLSSLGCGLSNSLAMLVAFRAFQGIGAAMAFAVNTALIFEIFPPEERGRSMGLMGSIVAVAGLIGPAIGGYIVQAAGWEYIFFINLPVGALMLLGAHKYLNLTETPANHAGQPLIDMSIFKDKNFTLANIGMVLFFIASFTITILMPFYLEQVMGFTPAKVGTFFMLVPSMTFFGAPISGYIFDKYAWKYQAAIGTLLQAIGMLLMAYATRIASFEIIIIAYLIVGLGTATFMSPNNTEIMNSLPRDRLNTSSSLLSTFRNFGMVAGVTLGSKILVIQMALVGFTGTVLQLGPQLMTQFVSNGMLYGFGLSTLGALICVWRNYTK